MKEPGPLGSPIFRAVWIANLASNLGTMTQSVGAAWAMTEFGETPQMIALVQAFQSLPILFLALPAGAIADIFDRRAVMLVAQVFTLVAAAGLALLSFAGLLSSWLLLVFTFLIGAGTALNVPAWQASVGDMVPRALVPGAVSFNAMGTNLARSAGPALGGAIVALGGGTAAFLFNSLSCIGIIVVLWRWRPDIPQRVLPRERFGDAMTTGIRYVWMSPKINVALLRVVLFALPAAAAPALMPLVARDFLDSGPLTYGLLLGAFGLGAVGGALASKRLRIRLGPERIMQLSTLLTILGLVGTALSRTPLVTVPILAVAGCGWVLAFSTINVTVQLASPRWVVARALSLYQMSVFGGLAIGSWIAGIVADDFGTEIALVAAAAFALAILLVGRLRPLADFNQDNLDTWGRWNRPDVALPIVDRSGPIVITLEYRIRPEDAREFLTLMRERRRMRLRDGARRWRLLRDLSDPKLWVERYHVANWIDYIRYNERRTQTDLANIAAVQRLNEGGAEPSVRRMIERPINDSTLSFEERVYPEDTFGTAKLS